MAPDEVSIGDINGDVNVCLYSDQQFALSIAAQGWSKSDEQSVIERAEEFYNWLRSKKA